MKISHRVLLTLLSVVLVIAAMIALAYAAENWAGRHAWAEAQRELQATGESLDWQHSIPPPIPDDQNLAFAPIYFRELAYQRDLKTSSYTFGSPSSYPTDLKGMLFSGSGALSHQPSGWDHAVRTDLSAYARCFRQTPGFAHPDQPSDPANDVLTALARYTPTLDELARAADQRPLTRFPVRWDAENIASIHLPQDNLQNQLIDTLRLRASSRLAAGQPAAALADVELALRLCRDLGNEPIVISHLIQTSCLRKLITPVWEGLLDRRWSADELARLQHELQNIDLLAAYLYAMRGERASVGGRQIDYFARHPGEILDVIEMAQGTPDPRPSHLLFRWVAPAFPQGCFDYNKALITRFMQKHEVESVNLAMRVVLPAKADAADRAVRAIPYLPSTVFAKIILPVFSGISRRTAHMQAGLDEAAVACALERFYLSHHSYPATLSELVPTYLDHVPTDVIDGAPLRYLPMPDGRYCLYEIGWNARDDGGQVAFWTGGHNLNDSEGDWVWQYTPLQPPPITQRSK